MGMSMTTSTTPDLAGFTPEQKEYLSGFFAGAMQRPAFVGITSSGRFTSDPASGGPNLAGVEDTYHGTSVSDLCREERWKFERNPLDVWDRLLQHADQNRAPQAEDVFRFKFHGLFYVAPAQDSFMLRLRIPGGRISSYQ